MAFQNLAIGQKDKVRTIILNRPDKLNALNKATISELHIAFDQATADESVHVIILTATARRRLSLVRYFGNERPSPVQARDFFRQGRVDVQNRAERKTRLEDHGFAWVVVWNWRWPAICDLPPSRPSLASLKSIWA